MNGVFNIVWLGDGFSHKNLNIFNDHCDHAEIFLQQLAPIDTFWNAGQIVFQRKIAKGNLNCTNSGFEVTTCNWQKVVDQGTINGIIPDLIHVFALGKGYGTGVSGISVLGLGIGVPGPFDLCDYWTKLVKLDAHEMGHAFGLGHSFTPPNPGNIMGQATNGGCGLGDTYLPNDQLIVANYINTRISYTTI